MGHMKSKEFVALRSSDSETENTIFWIPPWPRFLCEFFLLYIQYLQSYFNTYIQYNEMHYFSNLFDKVLYMFRPCPLSIIRSISTLYERIRYLSC